MSLFQEIDSILSKLDRYPYIETWEYEWAKTNDTISWVDDRGDLYSSEFNQGCLSRGDCILVNTDTGCGETVTMVFRKDKGLDIDTFHTKYGDL